MAQLFFLSARILLPVLCIQFFTPQHSSAEAPAKAMAEAPAKAMAEAPAVSGGTSARLLMTADVPVQTLVWTEDDSSFAVGESSSVSIRDADGGNVRMTLPVGGASSLGSARELGRDGTLFASLSDGGKLSVWDLGPEGASPADISFVEDPISGKTVPIGQLRFTSLAFSRNSDYIAAGMQDGGLRLFFKLRFSRQFIMREMGGQTGRITALAFSPDGRYLASASEDGSVMLVNSSSFKPVAKIPLYAPKATGPIDFAPDATLAAVLDSRSVVFYGTDGSQKGSLIVDADIKAIRFWAGGESLAVQGEDGSISFYYIFSGEQFAVIPPVQDACPDSFAFSGDGTALLEGYSNGQVYRFCVADYMRQEEPVVAPEPAVAAAPVQQESVPEPAAALADLGPAGDIGPVADPEPVDDPEPVAAAEPEKRTLLSNFNPSGRNSISIQAGGRLLQDPYDAAVELDLAFRMGTLLPPFYFGAALAGQLGKCFHADDFPNSYTWKGEDLDPPLSQSLSLYVPLGVQFAIRDSAFSVFSELHGGLKEVMLFQTCDEGLLRSKPHFVPLGGIYMGALFHGFMLQAGVDYDPVQRFTPGVLIGYSLTLPGGGKN